MAGRNLSTKTITECSSERNEGTDEKSVTKKQSSNDEMYNQGTNETFKVQNYHDYNVYSDVENVLNLNPVSYIDHVNTVPNVEEDSKPIDGKKVQEPPTNSLKTEIDQIQPPLVSTFITTAAHIIGPTPPSCRSAPIKRSGRRDDSDQNYNESVALNDEVISLFDDHKTGNNPSVSKHL